MLEFSKSPSVPVDLDALSIVDASTVSTSNLTTPVSPPLSTTDVVSNHDTISPSPKRWFPSKFFQFGSSNDGLTFRQRLAKAGLSVALSYGWVSNYSYACTMSLAWYLFSKRTGLSPLAPGQWKPFLAVYAAFYVFNNLVRPIRFALALSLSTYLDRMVQAIQNRWNCRRGVAMTVIILLGNVVGTFALMGLGISTASVAAGVPIWASTAKIITS
eukprot:Nitzschia sp. Nitz4//scaffold45_size130396//58438//59082//NITZ4_003448-RA/size130396-processed-gene-0.101-mRNA-1//-1//CDS//3329552395//2883//frame0